MNRRVALLGMGLLALCLTGCATDGDREQRASMSRVVSEPDAQRVLGRAAEILRREFGRVTIDAPGRRINTQPIEYQSASDSGTARDFVGARSTLRRVATFNCAARGETVLVQLRVDIEREESDRIQAQPQESGRFGDSPGHTPIERDAGVTRAQNQAWVFVKRDLRLERLLLEELQAVFEPPPAESQPAR
ncbi:MAG: hypothetical protein ACKVS9_10235 [Phycisphaerae bacterium]